MKFLDLQWQQGSLQPALGEAMARVLASCDFINGAATREFEAAYATYVGATHCVGVGNGTDSLEIILEAAGIGAGDEVIVPAMTFAATSEAVLRVGATPIIADVGNDLVLDDDEVRARLTERTRAIIPVHLYGFPVDVEGLASAIGRPGVLIVEDAAQAHGATLRGRMVGSLGHAASFSFYPGKTLGAFGDAGAITTSDAALAEKARRIANHGRLGKFDHELAGRNSRMDSLQGAVLRVKLAHLDSWVTRRREIADRYLAAWGGLDWLTLPAVPAGGEHGWHLFVLRVGDRERFRGHLHEAGVPTGIHYPESLPELAFHRGTVDESSYPVAVDAAARVVSVPIGEHLTDEEVAVVIETVLSYAP